MASLSNHALCEQLAEHGGLLFPRKAWFDRLTTNGILDKLTTNGILDRLTTDGILDRLITNGIT
ncbi:MAG TPA: hypothetical protein VF471_15885 [Pseudoxanthomonas sp.]